MAKKVTVILNCTYNDGKKTYVPGDTLSLDLKDAESLEKACLAFYPTTKPVFEKEGAKKSSGAGDNQQISSNGDSFSTTEPNTELHNGQGTDSDVNIEPLDSENLDPDALDELGED